MTKEASETDSVARLHDQRGALPNHQQHLPDRWCFGLAHPYMQRLIFLAGELERGAVNSDLGDCGAEGSETADSERTHRQP